MSNAISITFKKLPVFCYKCGRVGYGEAHCTFVSNHRRPEQPVPFALVETEMVQDDPETSVDEADKMQDGFVGESESLPE